MGVRRTDVTSSTGAHTWHVEPYDTSKCPAAQDNRRPESAALVVPFETGGSTVRDDETEHGTQSKRVFFYELDGWVTNTDTNTVSSVGWMARS